MRSRAAFAPPGQEGWLREEVKIAKPPYLAQTGWWIQRGSLIHHPGAFAPPLLSRRGNADSTSKDPITERKLARVRNS
jgi:hypothetical protein